MRHLDFSPVFIAIGLILNSNNSAMGKLLWTVVISFVVVMNVFGQSKTITGLVTDKTDGQPVIGQPFR
jgi:hypothetical protein